jgi:aryl-alcohol dehydrogenase-like predicted oxidoreductase
MAELINNRVGFGAWGIGGVFGPGLSYGPLDDLTAISSIATAISSGINFFDTSPAYGGGRSEELIGKCTKFSRGQVVLATKVGMSSLSGKSDFSLPAVKQSISNSLLRLQTNYIDIIQLHNPEPVHTKQVLEVLKLLDDYKQDGIILHKGLSLSSPDQFQYWSNLAQFDFLQINFSALDQRALTSDLPQQCLDVGTKVIARTPLCFGFLSDNPPQRSKLDSTDHRLRWNERQFSSWNAAANQIFNNFTGRSRQELAIRFCLSFPWVSNVITGIMSPAECSQNSAIGMLGKLPEKELNLILDNYYLASNLIPKITN